MTWSPTFDAKDVVIQEDKRVFDGFFKMHRLTLSHACFERAPMTITREIFRRGNAVVVLLFDPIRESLVLIEQFRAGAVDAPGGPWLLELVAGMVEPGESIQEVAERETQEEAGITVKHLAPILGYLPSPGGMDEWIDLWYGFVDASLASGIHGLDSEHEDIRVLSLPAQEVFDLLDQGRLNNGAIIIGVQWLRIHYDRIVQEGVEVMRKSNET
ncbi:MULTISPECIES: NUDIX domain-containing protein [Nitrincola]|uniref:ADP-ribose pyrophosphatase n=1 Tax=Nitrincola nitratireducens TaxID=1229521 RepID=W9UXK1_9GAMM|nr:MULTISPECIES: NUDIX domain-containing protein [Nitrincola]EXJ09441.1 ADP-ribose pyrophosphatase [Nitrincola nitratireducens]